MPSRIIPIILVVDDDLTVRLILTKILRSEGFSTILAENLSEAENLLGNTNIDLILLDVNLPDGSGYDFCKNLQGTPKGNIPIIFISSNDTVKDKVDGFDVGGVDYIPKPFEVAEVLARVKTHLKLKFAYDELAILNAQRIEKLTKTQQKILPEQNKDPNSKYHAIVHQINNAGGDFYSITKVGNDVTDYVVADVSGHDVDSLFWIASLKALLHEYSTVVNSPAQILHSINKTLITLLPEGIFFTIIYVRVNCIAKKMTVTSGAHPHLIHINKEGVSDVITLNGDILGAFSEAYFETKSIDIKQGDRFFLYSDGLLDIKGDYTDEISKLSMMFLKYKDVNIVKAVETIYHERLKIINVDDDTLLLGVEI
ncbi:MAG: SpoIIE family protein phosphatase [Candidatus Delongbacteria bacterium]|nr:SpoIIE family protein phosphatase [Candidatus Delongbacteria bacterium]MBN2833546.1 SpoIIE family protein phosphatase [Candidatus Delongbacteria bacterium]